MQQQTFHWHILGAGSIGLLFAYHLSKAGHNVTLIGRQQNVQDAVITANIAGKKHQQTLNLSNSENCQAIKLLLITVKAFDTQKALQSVAHALTADSQVFVLQNGLGQLAGLNQISAATIYPAITQAASVKTGPLSFTEHAKGQTFLPQSAKPLCNSGAFECDLPITVLKNFTEMQWQKLAANAVINPLTAIENCLNGEVLQLENFQPILQSVISEIVTVAHALQVTLDSNALTQQILQVINDTAGNSSSMREDIRHKKITEIDFINGYIVNQAKQLGINCPANQKLLSLVQQRQGF